MAIVTSHTVHVAILPNSSRLGESDASPIKLMVHTLGPTTHVLSQSPVVATLWHPCGVDGNCLLTVTAEAVVRLWELDRSNRWSFSNPALAIDLKKLAMASSREDDIAPYRMDDNRGFSTDSAYMEIATACFGGIGSSDEAVWSAMTLWVVTTDGDLYALCPLIPSKWQPTPTQLPSLATIAAAKGVFDQGSPGRQNEQDDQFEWIRNLDSQDPILLETEFNFPGVEVYSRPEKPGPIPQLQGPYQAPENLLEEYLDVSDIFVAASKIDQEELMAGEDEDNDQVIAEEGLSATVICLATKDGRLHVFLDLEGVEGQWLPQKVTDHKPFSSDYHDLLPFEVLETLHSNASKYPQWPSFSRDPFSRYSFFVTHSQGVYFLSLSPWLEKLDQELQNQSTEGSQFRLDIARNTTGTLREQILHFDHDRFSGSAGGKANLANANACIVLQDLDIGYFLLTSICNSTSPQGANLDLPKPAYIKSESHFDPYEGNENGPVIFGPARSPYEPHPIFWAQSSIPFMLSQIEPHRRRLQREEVRLSSSTLDLMTQAHRTLSVETHEIGVAAADLFNRCERLIEDLSEQIKSVAKLSYSADTVSDGYVDGKGDINMQVERRLENAAKRQQRLHERTARLRKKVGRLGGRELSAAEKDWGNEVRNLERIVLQPEVSTQQEDDEEDDFEGDFEKLSIDGVPVRNLEMWRRYGEVKKLTLQLIGRAKNVAGSEDGYGERVDGEDNFDIPMRLKNAKVAQVMQLLERETALVDAVQLRVRTLQTDRGVP